MDVDFIDDPYLELIADVGAPFVAEARLIRKGQRNDCHRNAATFWLKGKCDDIAVGYYLGPDGVWRQHSWGVMPDGVILDTHSAGRSYFGARLKCLEAAQFAEDCLGLAAVLRSMKRTPERFKPILAEALRALATQP
jgi:hypothetical protein